MATPKRGIRKTRKLRQWTIEQVESGKFPGVMWEDPPTKTMFRIPWKHAGKQEFRHDEDAGFFKEWAMFKGKYRPGEPINPAAWKTRIRCAFSKSPEFEEVPERSQQDIAEPYKVYRLVPVSEQLLEPQAKPPKAKKMKLERSKKKASADNNMLLPSDSLPILQLEVVVEPASMATNATSAFNPSAYPNGESSPQAGEPAPDMNENMVSLNPSLGSTMDSSGVEAASHACHMSMEMSADADSAGSLAVHRDEHHILESIQLAFEQGRPLPPWVASWPEDQYGDYYIILSIFYNGELIQCECLPAGEFLISSIPAPAAAVANSMNRVVLPLPEKTEDHGKQEAILHFLKDLEKGIMVASNTEGIFVQCRGKASIFWRGPLGVQAHGRLENDAYLRLFNTREFKAALEQFHLGLGSLPEHRVILCVGEDVGEAATISSKLLIIQMEQFIALRWLASPTSPSPAVEASSCLDPISLAILSASTLS